MIELRFDPLFDPSKFASDRNLNSALRLASSELASDYGWIVQVETKIAPKIVHFLP